MLSPQPRVLVVINPASATGKRGAIGSRVADTLKAEGYAVVALIEPTADALANSLARAMSTEPPLAVVAVGGDGLVNLVTGQLVGSAIPLGLVPTGTGNDLARGLGIPDTIDASLAALVSRLGQWRDSLATSGDSAPTGIRSIDTAEVEIDGVRRTFVGALSAGFDAAVNERTNRMTFPRGSARYVVAVLAELVALKPREYRLTVDGETRQVTGVLVSVANNGSIGGGMRIVPDAQLNDGQLDVFIVSAVGRLRFLRIFPSVFRGTHVGLPEVTIVRGQTATVESAGIVAFADGERMGALPATVRVVPASLRALA
ncbi:diacylglycerol/lipid kinase family protein [Lysinibacter cavernae]|uniref:Diacylglycerol kinase (ATP) n=1 Tax=Lysinibacter cavernae TaxID=1640652 RepID=A0A7X5TSE1_9MICO|nr:diacylglycerol kinase family protein [Lysinibacter cavernae]NIH53406.1 diacylglycerol kinase (ATP) [Lysinibacter cavernae]